MAPVSSVVQAPRTQAPKPQLEVPKTYIINERFELNPQAKNYLRSQKANFGFGLLSEAVYFRTYSRLQDDGTQEQWADTVIRVVEGVMSVRKDWYKNVLGKRWDDKKSQGIATALASYMFEMKILPPGRGLWAMGTDYVYERGSMALNNCLHGDTRIVTSDGHKALRDLVGTRPTVLSRNGRWIEAEVQSFGRQSLWRIRLSRYGVEKEILATPDHIWFVRGTHGQPQSEVATSALRPGQRLVSQWGQGVFGSVRPSSFGIAHGVTFGDGTRPPATVGGNHPARLPLIGEKDAQLLKWFPHSPTRLNHPQPHIEATEVQDLPRYFKDKPSIQESKSYLLGWLMGYFAADGTVLRDGSAKLASADRGHLAFARDVAVKLGIGTTPIAREIHRVEGKEFPGYALRFLKGDLPEGFFLIEQHRLRAASPREGQRRAMADWKIVSVEDAELCDEVYCAVVPETQAFTLEDNILTHNCGAVVVNDTLSGPIAWAADALMSGVGVGFSTHQANLKPLHMPASNGTQPPWVIPDTREGWAESYRRLIETYEEPGQHELHFDYTTIRPKGAPIRSFGGTAAGPSGLIEGHERLRVALDAYAAGSIGQSRLIVDAFNIMGYSIVSGNVRNSAELAIGAPGDEEFINLKNYEMHPERSEIGFVSNNSIALSTREDFQSLPDIADRIRDNGEPGILNFINARKYGRIGDRMPDDVVAVNPCAEIFLEDMELCNLVEVFPTKCSSDAEIYEAMKLATFYASTVALLRSHSPETNEVVSRNRRIGVSISGIADWIDSTSVSHVFNLLNTGYEQVVRPTNKRLAKEAGVPESVRVTTVKPSGTISLLAGVSPGMHHPFDGYVLRRMRIASDSPVRDILVAAGVPHEPDVTNPKNTDVFDFPLHYGHGRTRSVKNVSIFEQAALVAMLQKSWADNEVSNTLTVQPSEYGQIEKVLSYFAPQVKSLSLLPDHDYGAFAQMPLEKIHKDEFDTRRKAVGTPDWQSLTGSDGADSRYCSNDSCEI